MPETASQPVSVPELVASARRVSDAPYTGHIFAFITCTRVKWGQDDEGNTCEDATEEHGWIDRSWSPYVLHDSRNDARPVVDVDLSDTETLADECRDALGWLEGGAEDNGDGTFYSADSYTPYGVHTDDRGEWTYSYALHFTRKFLGPKGWTEEAWIPPMDMRP